MKENRVSWTYSNLSPTKWEKIKNVCQTQYNFNITGHSGTATFLGVKVQYTYHPETEIGQITILDKPMIMPNSLIKMKIDEVFNSIN